MADEQKQQIPWTTQAGAITDAVQAGTQLLGIGLQNTFNQSAYGNQRALQHQQFLNQLALANNQQKLSQENWDYTNYENQVKHMQNAGLNVGLMYNGSGQGGQSLGQSQGSAASASAPPVVNPFMNANFSGIADNLANMELKKAQAELANAQAKKIASETPTSGNTGDINLENLKQSGIGQLQANKLQAWMMSDPDVRQGEEYNKTYDYHVGVGEDSQYAKQIDAQLLKTASETNSNLANIDLTNQKIAGYWTELLNETKKANAAGIQAAAQKLTSEWNTGEFTNWKTWADLGVKAVQSIGSLIKGGTTINKESTYNQNGDRWNDK